MANVRIFADKLLVGALCSLSLAACTGGASPTAPTASPGVTPGVLSSFTRSEVPVQAPAALRKKSDNRFVTCSPADGSFVQISVEAMGGVNQAVQHCHKVLNGKSGGVVKAPPPEVP